jgi:hypothetical protein
MVSQSNTDSFSHLMAFFAHLETTIQNEDVLENILDAVRNPKGHTAFHSLSFILWL